MTHTKDEALKLALEALETIANAMPFPVGKSAITAIKQALANAALDRKAENARELGLDYEPAFVQEPIAFFDPQEKGFYWAKPMKIIAPITVDVEPLPLYTTPPAAQRPWLDLTDEQIKAIDEMALTKNMAIAMTMRTLKEVNT
jgi:hypothetical protein